uniref:Carboxypeptidase n=1 Tax=Guillardia theta TaxID=55529 RepID=A2AX36_GUITH|nr:cathepsin A [Guillardia theta]
MAPWMAVVAMVAIGMQVALAVPTHSRRRAGGGLAEPLAPGATDEITDLPGLPKEVSKFKQYAGYIPVGGGKSLFYWFVEAQKNPASSPLVLWTNGGPGCSGLTGFLSEQGPFRAEKGGQLSLNKYSWNRVANMIFIEQPAGVGFSQGPSNMTYGDAEAAKDNRAFVLGFLSRYPMYKDNDLYLTSESYGGHYIPTLAMLLLDLPNFKGFAVGNPLTWMPYRDYGQYAAYASRQLIPKPLWDRFVALGCFLFPSANQTDCDSMTASMDAMTANMDPYALDFPICQTPSLASGRTERYLLLKKIASADKKQRKTLSGYFPKYKPCVDDYMTQYLNRKDVQKAIHVSNPGSVTWSVCSDVVNEAYNPKDVAAPMMGVYNELIKHGGLKMMIYSGDDDSICSTAGAQMWIWGLGKPIEEWQQWSSKGQVAGFTVKFPGLRFTTVHGAGHMVPSTAQAGI